MESENLPYELHEDCHTHNFDGRMAESSKSQKGKKSGKQSKAPEKQRYIDISEQNEGSCDAANLITINQNLFEKTTGRVFINFT